MWYYLLVFLFSLNTLALDISKDIDSKIKVISEYTSFSEKKENISSLREEISRLKASKKLSNDDFYISTDFLKVLDSILTMSDYSESSCFDTNIEVMSNFGIRSADLEDKGLPIGAKKGMILLKLICSKKK